MLQTLQNKHFDSIKLIIIIGTEYVSWNSICRVKCPIHNLLISDMSNSQSPDQWHVRFKISLSVTCPIHNLLISDMSDSQSPCQYMSDSQSPYQWLVRFTISLSIYVRFTISLSVTCPIHNLLISDLSDSQSSYQWLVRLYIILVSSTGICKFVWILFTCLYIFSLVDQFTIYTYFIWSLTGYNPNI